MFRSKNVLRNAGLYLLLGSLCAFIGCSKPETNQGSTTQTQASPDRDKDHGGEKKFTAPGTCSDPGNCDSNNTCPVSGTCTVIVVNNNGTATATIQGKTPTAGEQPYVCATSGTQIAWQTGAGGQQFIGDFGPSSPWTSVRNYIVGNSSTPDTETAGSAAGCYKYNLTVCNMVCAVPNKPCALQCGITDPIVIIGQDPKNAMK
jgi:hypothetical protein